MSRSHVPFDLRQRVAQRARYRCGYCLTSEAIVGTPMEIDHLVPAGRGGPTLEANLWLACALCNSHKGKKTSAPDPVSSQIVPIFDPRRQVWGEHFAWIDGGVRVLGVTAMGRATVETLSLNRPVLMRARRRWVQVGWHPPKD